MTVFILLGDCLVVVLEVGWSVSWNPPPILWTINAFEWVETPFSWVGNTLELPLKMTGLAPAVLWNFLSFP